MAAALLRERLPVALWCRTLPQASRDPASRSRCGSSSSASWLPSSAAGRRPGRRLERGRVFGGRLEDGRVLCVRLQRGGFLRGLARGARFLLADLPGGACWARSPRSCCGSCFGIASTMASSPRSPTRRSKILRSSSVCAISRPRNIIAILTLFPAEEPRDVPPSWRSRAGRSWGGTDLLQAGPRLFCGPPSASRLVVLVLAVVHILHTGGWPAARPRRDPGIERSGLFSASRVSTTPIC